MCTGRVRRTAWLVLSVVGLVHFPSAFAQTGAPPSPKKAATPVPQQRSLSDSLPADVKNEYEAGKILFEDGDYATALLKFQDAYARTTDARLLWNVGACLKNLRHYAKAIEILRTYLADTSGKLTPQDRQDATDLMGAIEPFTTSVTFKVSEDGAALWLDDAPIGSSPLPQSVLVDLGARRLRVQKDGFRLVDKEIAVGGVKDAVVEVVLEKSGGHLELVVASDATVVLDDKSVGQGPLIRLDLSVGGHALRITAPAMHPYQGDVTIEDGQTRTLAIKLEPDVAQSSELRIAAGCRDPAVRVPNEGLTVYLDNSPISASPLGVRTRSTASGESPAYVPFTVSPGSHLVTVRFPECEALSATATTPAGSGATIEGVLPPVHPWFNGSPAGSPNGWRVSAGFAWTTVKFDSFQNFFGGRAVPSRVDLSLAGLSTTFGLEGRWVTLLVDGRYMWGSTTGSIPTVNESGPRPTLESFSENASIHQVDGGVRIGARVPLYVAALSFGPGANLGGYSLSSTHYGRSAVQAGGGAWAAIDAKFLCDFGVEAGGGYYAVVYGGQGGDVDATTATSFFIHAEYEPNQLCERKVAGMYQLGQAQ
jgi:hypothetical protein